MEKVRKLFNLMFERKFPDKWYIFFLSLVIFVNLLVISSLPIGSKLNYIYIDDSFYYIKTAQNVVEYGFPTFDGVEPTSGLQPLWTIFLVIIFFLFAPITPMAVLNVTFIMQSILYVTSVFLFFKWVKKVVNSSKIAFISTLVFSSFYQYLTLFFNGMETSLAVLIYLAFILVIFNHKKPLSPVLVGILGGLGFLARVDMIFLLGFFIIYLFKKGWGIQKLFLTTVFSFIIVLPYLIYIYQLEESFLPIAGTVKVFISSEYYENWIDKLSNIFWVFVQLVDSKRNSYMTLYGLLSMLFVLFLFQPRRNYFIYCAIGILSQYIFYALAFHFPWSAARWYYFPLMIFGSLFLGIILDWSMTLVSKFPRKIFFFIGLLGIIGMLCLIFFTPKISPRFIELFLVTFVTLIINALISVVIHKHNVRYSIQIISIVIVMVSLTFGLRHQNLRENFRNNKYKSAQWVKNNIPIESNIASWDCGIFSFFSERPIINLDGLINSRNYYENYLKPKQLHSYLQKREVDYLINQFDPDDNSNRLNLINKEYVQLQEIPILDDFKNYPNGQEFRVFRISYLKPE